MINRVKEIRKNQKLNMHDFGNRLGVTAAAISRIESGERNLTDQMIKSICREFNINETWLRSGEGPMQNLPEDEDAALVAELLVNHDSEFCQLVMKLLKAYNQLDPADQKVIQNFADKLMNDK